MQYACVYKVSAEEEKEMEKGINVKMIVKRVAVFN